MDRELEIGVEEMKRMQDDGFCLIDVRSEHETNYGTIPGARVCADVSRMEAGEYGERLILYCGRGEQTTEQVRYLREKGILAYSLRGGYYTWLTAKLALKEADTVTKQVEESIRKRFKRTIWSSFTRAINEYELVKEGDHIAVCISGGKDSMLMAKLFQELKRHRKFDFQVSFLVMDPGYSTVNRQLIEGNARRMGIPVRIFESDIFDSVFTVEKSPCYLCARMRRGHLYSFARQMGCNKIALGHHYDDVIETILMGMLYSAQLQTMMPKLHSTNFEGMELIRPMYLIREEAIKQWRDVNDLHFLQCACRFTNTCSVEGNSMESGSKRLEIKRLIRELKKTNPFVEGNIFKSVENANLDTLIAYKQRGEKHHFLDTYGTALCNRDECRGKEADE